MNSIFMELGITYETSIPIFDDSQSAQSLAKSCKLSQRTKHMKIRLHLVQHMVNAKICEVRDIRSPDNVANMHTKLLGAKPLSILREATMTRVPSGQ
jgi:hypothetical protein